MQVDVLTEGQSEIVLEQAAEIVFFVSGYLCQLCPFDRLLKMIGNVGVHRKDKIVARAVCGQKIFSVFRIGKNDVQASLQVIIRNGVFPKKIGFQICEGVIFHRK